MNFLENNEYICRICLDPDVVFDWNDELFAFCGVTYKDCYFKYTQLEYLVTDTFSMLCQNCCDGLQNVHAFISKALESHELLQNKYRMISPTVDHPPTTADDIEYSPTEFETVLVEKVEIEHVIQQDSYVCDNSDEEFIAKPIKKSKKPASSAIKKSIATEVSEDDLPLPLNSSHTYKTPAYTQQKTPDKSKTRKLLAVKELRERKDHNSTLIEDEPLDDNLEEKCDTTISHEVNEKDLEKNTPRMCSICSKILRNKYALQLHEATHVENRERNITCTVCGLKFYDKRNLYSHRRIHRENRQKRHKCEFCDKGFYTTSNLNVHRRRHLGQVIPCNLCPKKFYRQVDFESHIMRSHSATTINSDIKQKSRYFVRCEHCDKSICTTKYSSHLAAHVNEPLMKCSICNKEYIHRKSCVRHVKNVHQKTNEYNDFIIIYTKKRLSHLYLKQNAEVQTITESIIDV